MPVTAPQYFPLLSMEALNFGEITNPCFSLFSGSPMSKGKFQFDMWDVTPTDLWDWDAMRKQIKRSVGNCIESLNLIVIIIVH